MDSTERLMLHNAMNDYKTENNKLTEQVLERDTHIDILDKEIGACRQVNAFAMKKLKDIITEMDLAEMIGLGKDTGTDIAITHMAVEHKKLKEENEKLKDKFKWKDGAYDKCLIDFLKTRDQFEKYKKEMEDPVLIDKNVEDSITNQLDNLNEAVNTDFETIEELYGAWHECSEKVKEQDEYILGCKNQVDLIEELKEENEKLTLFNEWNKSATLKWNEEVEVNRRMKELNERNVKLIKDMIKNQSIRINNIQDEGDVYDLLQELEDC